MKPLPPARPHGPRHLIPARVRASFGAAVGLGLLLPCAHSADEAARRIFDIPAGDAAATLKHFAAQSGEQLLYTPDDVSGVPTRGVRGELTPMAALERMFEGTRLKARQDETTKAIAITASQPSRDPPSSQPSGPSPDQPKNSASIQLNPPAVKQRTLLSVLASWLTLGVVGHAQQNPGFTQSGSVSTAVRLEQRESVQVVGRIKNLATGDYLRSALIQVEGTNLSTLSDFGGTFAITVPPGRQTLIVSYTGLDTSRVSVDARLGTTVTRDVDMTSGIYSLEPFTVRGEREGNALAIQLQRQALNAKTVVATDAYGNPAANPAEVLQRLPGITPETITGGEIRSISVRGLSPEFSTLMIDGETVASSVGSSASRGYQPEQFGTTNLSAVEFIKAPTPDQDANAVAGFINLVTKRAFEQAGRRISLTAGVMWRDLGFSGNQFHDRLDDLDLIALSYSDVFSILKGSKNLGVSIDISRRLTTGLQDESGNVFVGLGSFYLNPLSDNPLQRVFGSGEYQQVTRAYTGGAKLEYKFSDTGYAFAKFTVNTNQQSQQLYRTGFGDSAATLSNFAPGSTYERSTLLPHAASTAISRSYVAPKRKTLNYAVNLGTEHDLFANTAKLSLRFNYSYANLDMAPVLDVQATAIGIGFEIDRRGRDAWYPNFAQAGGPSIYDPASYTMRTLAATKYEAPNTLSGARADFTKRFQTVVPTSIKAGFKFDDSKREPRNLTTNYTWVGADGVPNSADDAMTPYAKVNYKQSRATYGPFPFMSLPGIGRPGDPVSVPNGYWAQTANDVYNGYSSSKAAMADFDEKISAGYMSGSVNLGALRILAGLRVEETKNEGTAWVRNQTAAWGGNSVGGASLESAVVAANLARAERSFVSQRTSGGSYRKIFPGLHFVLEPWQKGLLVRASYNSSISRPPVANLLPTVTESLTTNTVSVGNPELRPYTSDNFELGIEKYFEPVGLFSAGVFLKEIKDYFRSGSSQLGPEGLDGNGLYANFTVTRTFNVGNARIRGAELNYQQSFKFLPGFWSGFGTFANFTYTEGLGNFGTLVTSNKLPNLTPRTANAGISYIKYNWQVRFMANWRDRSYGGTSTIDYYRAERLAFDFKLQYRINRTYDVYFDALNFNDAPTREDETPNGLPWIRNRAGASLNAGVNARF